VFKVNHESSWSINIHSKYEKTIYYINSYRQTNSCYMLIDTHIEMYNLKYL